MSFGLDETLPLKQGGKPKGLQVVLEERGLWPSGSLYFDCTALRKDTSKEQKQHSGDNCCAHRLLSQQPDFQAQKGQVEEVVESM